MTVANPNFPSQAPSLLVPAPQPDRAFVPYAKFVQLPQEASHSRLPARLRKLPVLQGFFNHELFDFAPNLPVHVGYGRTGTGDINILTFRLQRGPNMLYWLANPADPCVWEAMDLWAAAKALVLMASFPNGECVIMSRSFSIAPPIQTLRAEVKHAATRTAPFCDAAADLIGTGELQHIATSDIPRFTTLDHVQGCLVSTPVTPLVSTRASEVKGTPYAARFLAATEPPLFMSSLS